MDFLEQRQRAIDHDLVAGHDEQSLRKTVTLSDRQRSTHVYCTGMSGSGKSRWLQNLIFQDIRKGHPICVIDPMGDLYSRILEYIASGLEHAGDRGFPVADLLERYLFLDAGDPKNPLRINPLAATDEETTEQQVDDILRAFERQTGSMDEQQRRRMIMRGIFHITAALNRLSPERRPRMLPGKHTQYPLNLFFAADILTMTDEERFGLLAALPESSRLEFRRLYWDFFAQGSTLEKFRQLQSTFTALQYLLDDDLVLRVFDTSHSTFSVSEVLRQGRSLICHLPIGGNLTGASFLGKFLTTKLQQAAYRRPEVEWCRRYYLYIDEFHLFADPAFAESLTNLRKFGVSVCVAHQSQTQPPFDTAEGQALLKTMKGNSRVHAVFRLSRPDAEIVGRDLFELTQQKENFQTVDHSVGRSEQSTRSTSHSSGHSTGSGTSSSRSQASGSGQQQHFDREKFDFDWGTSSNHSHGLSDGRSEHVGHSSNEQHSESSMEGTTESTTTRTIYYPLEGERELMTNALQKLDNRKCYLYTGALQGAIIETPFVPDELYVYQAVNFPAQLIEWQRSRLRRLTAEADVKEEEPILTRILPFAPTPAHPKPFTGLPPESEEEEAEDVAAQPLRRQGNYPFVD